MNPYEEAMVSFVFFLADIGLSFLLLSATLFLFTCLAATLKRWGWVFSTYIPMVLQVFVMCLQPAAVSKVRRYICPLLIHQL